MNRCHAAVRIRNVGIEWLGSCSRLGAVRGLASRLHWSNRKQYPILCLVLGCSGNRTDRRSQFCTICREIFEHVLGHKAPNWFITQIRAINARNVANLTVRICLARSRPFVQIGLPIVLCTRRKGHEQCREQKKPSHTFLLSTHILFHHIASLTPSATWRRHRDANRYLVGSG